MIDDTIEIRESVEYTRKDNESIESGKISIYFRNILNTEAFLEKIRLICKETREQKPTIPADGTEIYKPDLPEKIKDSYQIPQVQIPQSLIKNDTPVVKPCGNAEKKTTSKRKPKHKDWSDEEQAVIQESKTSAEAVKIFFERFPESDRTRMQIQSYWCYRHPKETREIKPSGILVGNRVVQITGKEPAIGPGTVTSILADGRVKVQFLHRVKVLDPKHFRLVEELPDA